MVAEPSTARSARSPQGKMTMRKCTLCILAVMHEVYLCFDSTMGFPGEGPQNSDVWDEDYSWSEAQFAAQLEKDHNTSDAQSAVCPVVFKSHCTHGFTCIDCDFRTTSRCAVWKSPCCGNRCLACGSRVRSEAVLRGVRVGKSVPPFQCRAIQHMRAQHNCVATLAQEQIVPFFDEAGRDVAEVWQQSEVLEAATAEPTPGTLPFVSKKLEMRAVKLMQNALAEFNAASGQHANHCARWAWIMPSLLLRAPVREGRTKTPAECAGDFSLTAVVRRRIQMAEQQQWDMLLKEFMEEKEQFKKAQWLATRSEAAKTFPDDDLKETHEKTVAAVQGDCVSRARRMLECKPSPPKTLETAQQMEELVCRPVDDDHREALIAEIAAVCKSCKPVPRPKQRMARRRMTTLRSGAAPGPSGMRNRHLLMMMQTTAGMDTVLNFAHLVADGRLSAVANQLWMAAVLEPVDQGVQADNSRKIRPIGLGEALVKFAETLALDMAQPEITKWLEPAQRGICTSDGVVQVVRTMRGWAKDMQDQAAVDQEACLVSTDLQNAFCNFYRHKALQTMREQCPAVARMMAGHWSAGPTLGWQRVTGSNWRRCSAERGGWQGSRATMVAYAIDAEAAFHKAELAHIARIGITDDFYLAGSASHIATKWPMLEEALQEHGHSLRRHKCTFWVPSWDVVSEEERQSDATRGVSILNEYISQSFGGMRMLGSAAQGKWKVELGSGMPMQAAADERCEDAGRACRKLADLAKFRLTDGSVQAAWTILQKSASRALDFDIRMCPHWALQAQRSDLAMAMEEVVDAVTGRQLKEQQREQVQLPGAFGGMSLKDLADDMCAAAYLSAWQQHREAIPKLAVLLGRPILHEVDSEDAERAREVLLEAGITMHEGQPTFTAEAAEEYEKGPWVADTPTEAVFRFTSAEGAVREQAGAPSHADTSRARLCGRICRGLQALRATRLWRQLSPDGKVALLASGGPGAGQTWTTIPLRKEHQVHNACFRTMIALKLDIIEVPAGCVCALPLTGEGRRCAKHIDRRARHPDVCNSAARERAHGHLRARLAQRLVRAGAFTDEEVVVPDLCIPIAAGGCTERIMDIVARWPTSAAAVWLDVTIRSPWAKRYAKTDKDAEATGRKAAAEKLGRYGEAVWPVPFTTLGRLAASGIRALAQLDAEARDAGKQIRARDLRTDLEFEVLRAGAETMLRALGVHFGLATGRWRADARSELLARASPPPPPPLLPIVDA